MNTDGDMGSDGGGAYAFTVHVEPRYIPGESAPEQGRHVFAYTIVVENVGEQAARLMSRRWLITDGDGRKQEVQGPGVVGKQPRIPPGDSFRYTSAAVLETAVGCMEGHYEFHADDGAAFTVPIPAFTLAMPNAVH